MTFLKITDALIFITMSVFALYHFELYQQTANNLNGQLFELTIVVAALYTMLRKRDADTVTLGITVLAVYCIANLAFLNMDNMSGFWVYLTYFIFNLLTVLLIWFRPLIFGRIKLWRGSLHITRQDRYMWATYALNAVFMLAMLIEHGLRKIDQSWYENARFFYNRFELIQLIFLLCGMLVLYYMTFDGSKERVGG